ncbi:glycosyltransferase family 4 protein [Sphingobacterium sp. LRF_L2]|uniref:glycosyltransferase family 4 protein n=1 Tax=Sphingobacterium sp. LRF_L2 TaxID=3369421 RepID=UPI003F6422CA
MLREDTDNSGNTIFVKILIPMRILIIHNFYQHAGGEDTVFQQEVEMLSKQHQVEVFTVKNQKGLSGIRQFLTYPFNILESYKLKKIIAKFTPDIVHIHNLHYAIGPWFIHAIYRRKIPIVMTLHNFRLLCPSASLFFHGQIFTNSLAVNFPWEAIKLRVLDHSFLKTLITAFTYWWHRKIGTWNKINTYIVLSEFAKNIFNESTFPVAASRFAIHPNSVSLHPLKIQKTASFVYIGRLAEEKGIMPLLQAISGMGIPLYIYGDGPQRDQVLDFAERYPDIHYMGYQSREVLLEALAQADALIVPSVCYEGMPITIIEALAQGTPVLASAIGILKEMIIPLYTGMHFDPFDRQDIKKVLHEWKMLSAKKKLEIASNCKEEYAKKYTLERSEERLLSIYRNAIRH